MDVANPEGSGRKCVCCGAPRPTRSMCACWDHWTALPEDLRSELLRSYSRDEIGKYHRALLEAVELAASWTSGGSKSPTTSNWNARSFSRAGHGEDADGSGSQCRYRQARVKFKVPLTWKPGFCRPPASTCVFRARETRMAAFDGAQRRSAGRRSTRSFRALISANARFCSTN